MGANFTPSLSGYTGQGQFRFWCQKVLPLVYDDSLSYYELLNKVVTYLNNTISDVSALETNMGNLHTAYVELEGYVNSYFDNLDVQNAINNKLDEMAESGELSEILSPLLDPMRAEMVTFKTDVTNEVDAISRRTSTLQSEIDAIIALPDGSTTADGELTNIRTGVDIGFSTAGNAVRGQISEISQTTNNKLLLENYTTTLYGVTVTADYDNSITLSGTCTNSGGRGTAISGAMTLTAGEYVLLTSAHPVIVYLTDGTGSSVTTVASVALASPYYKHFVVEETTVCYLSIGVANGTTYNEKFYVGVFPYAVPFNFTPYRTGRDAVTSNAVAEINRTKLSSITETNTLEDGTINVDSGQNAVNAKRVRTPGYYDGTFLYASVDPNTYAIWGYGYDEDYEYIGHTPTSYVFPYMSKEIIDGYVHGAVYYRLVVKRQDDGNISPTDNINFHACSNDYVKTIDRFGARITALEDTNYSPIGTLHPVSGLNSGSFSDMTFVGNWLVTVAAQTSEQAANIYAYQFADGVASTPTATRHFTHTLGHANTVDYSGENGYMMISNGSGEYNLAPVLYLIPDFAGILTDSTNYPNGYSFTTSDCKVVNLNAIEASKANAVWGESSGARNDIIYMSCADLLPTASSGTGTGDNGKIYKIMLGTGSNELDINTSYSSASDGVFNGSAKILETYTQNTLGYPDANQGTCFVKGKIVATIGHGILKRWDMAVKDSKITKNVYTQTFYGTSGAPIADGTYNPTGCCYYDGKLFVRTSQTGIAYYNENV